MGTWAQNTAAVASYSPVFGVSPLNQPFTSVSLTNLYTDPADPNFQYVAGFFPKNATWNTTSQKFDRPGKKFRDVVDGLSNTIILVEADPDLAVEWTKPEDWQFDPNDPAHGLGGLRPMGFLAAFGDGSVRFIPNSTSPQEVQAMMTAAGREPPVR